MKKILFITVALMLFILSGCINVEVSENTNDLYSRQDVKFVCESNSFGKNKSDDVYVALSYVYENKEIQKTYGENFTISPENIICYNSEGESFMFSGIFKGKADYGFILGDAVYRVQLSKNYFGKWEVIKGYFEE